MSRRAEIAPTLVTALSALTVFAGVAGRAAAQSIPLSPGAQASGAQITYSLGYEFVTVDVHNNPAFTPAGQENQPAYGRGSVAEPFRIGRFEVTTAQWVQFFNAWSYVSATQGVVPFVQIPGSQFWGALPAANPYGAGQGWRVPAGNEMRAVGNISWRTAAILCNWLCSGQALTRDAFMSGAYDVNTFGYINGAMFTDQSAHTPGAQYYIPSLDQWIAAAHYDPNRYGAGQPGYWLWANAGDAATPRGIPGIGGANWGTQPNGELIPLGAYPDFQSPWGLLDSSGGTAEWTESFRELVTGNRRYFEGSSWFDGNEGDSIWSFGGDFPSFSPLYYGVRIASDVPGPGTFLALAPLSLILSHRRQRLDRQA
ncbi:MAG: SUMF1/EgtB/PvdO family nonheme iron enzyme [Phycisphaerales bacterium]